MRHRSAVTTGAGTGVTGGIGIYALNYGGGPLTVTANGDVTGTNGPGIYAFSAGAPIAITVGPKADVRSDGTGPVDFAIDIAGASASVTVAGRVDGGAGGAILFNQCGCGSDDRLELQPGAVMNGIVFAGPGSDTFALGGEGTANFDVSAMASACNIGTSSFSRRMAAATRR